MPMIYLYKDDAGYSFMTQNDATANDAANSGFCVYALDVEEYVPTPPKEARWVVVDADGGSLHKRVMCGVRATDPAALSYARESDAIILKDVLTRGGMTGLTVRKIEE